MKKGGGSKKGGGYEREICTRLSMWWCGRDDTLWRTGGSGGRATVRGRKGKTTAGGCGDICATDSISEPLMKFVTIECKRGYSKTTPYDMIDKKSHAKAQQWEEWIEQASLSCRNAKSKYWAIIARRNQRDNIIMMPLDMFNYLEIAECAFPYATFSIETADQPSYSVAVMKLEDFFDAVNPKQLARRLKNVG